MLIFVDGACSDNGKKNAKASYAALINGNIIKGFVMPFEYVYNDKKLDHSEITISPSNNRAELLAIIVSLIEVLESEYDDITIYSDSLISVNTVNIWYENRNKKGTINKFKNLDLIKIMMELYYEINKSKQVKIKHVRGHQKEENAKSEEHKNIIIGNNIADIYAELLLKDDITYDIIRHEVDKKYTKK